MIKILFFIICSLANAMVLDRPTNGNVADELTLIRSRSGDTLDDIAARYLIASEHIQRANPHVSWRRLDDFTLIILPSSVILPKAPRHGLVVNLAEKRIYDYTTPGKIHVYSVGIGRENWPTPLGTYKITGKRHLPVWNVPKAVMQEEKEKGNILPKRVPPGPENPLGEYAMRLSHSSYLIHGTNDESNIGIKSTSGCVSMYNDDIEELFKTARIGTTVTIVDQPIKVGHKNGKKWVEIHLPKKNSNNNLTIAKEDAMMAKILGGFNFSSDELKLIDRIISENSNLPHRLN